MGGNDPLIIMEGADLEKAVFLVAEGSFRNSGQRCTAVKRILVHEKIKDAFIEKFVEKTKEYTCGDTADPQTRCKRRSDRSNEMLHVCKNIFNALVKLFCQSALCS